MAINNMVQQNVFVACGKTIFIYFFKLLMEKCLVAYTTHILNSPLTKIK